MSELRSFEMAYEREGAAAMIIQALGHQVCEGLVKADWTVSDMDAICMLSQYDERQIIQDGENISVPIPFYLLHATYNHGGSNAVLRINFDTNFSIPTRKTLEIRALHSQKDYDWDLAMGICDELMRAGVEAAAAYDQKKSLSPKLRII